MMNSVVNYITDKKITFDHVRDEITFSMLTMPASQGGDMSKAQLVDLIKVAKHMLEYLNAKFPCRENAMTITKLDEALMWQEKRTQDRITRGVEGHDKQ